MSQDFYTAGFCPGAIVYFSYDASKGEFMQLEESFCIASHHVLLSCPLICFLFRHVYIKLVLSI